MIEIKVPTVGESINEVTLVKWLKKDGDYVQRDEVIAELESEKATFEVNAEQAGILKTVGKEGDTLQIGDVVAQIDDKAKSPGANGKAPAEAAAGKQDIKATPVASAIIADKKIDTKNIQPSGYNGKILKEDVLEALSLPGRK